MCQRDMLERCWRGKEVEKCFKLYSFSFSRALTHSDYFYTERKYKGEKLYGKRIQGSGGSLFWTSFSAPVFILLLLADPVFLFSRVPTTRRRRGAVFLSHRHHNSPTPCPTSPMVLYLRHIRRAAISSAVDENNITEQRDVEGTHTCITAAHCQGAFPFFAISNELFLEIRSILYETLLLLREVYIDSESLLYTSTRLFLPLAMRRRKCLFSCVSPFFFFLLYIRFPGDMCYVFWWRDETWISRWE